MKYIHFFFCLLLGMAVQAQIKIGDNPQNIDPSSVLELESSSRVLVITRVNTAQMNAIIPSAGAMVYNTDIQCIHYYTGAEWKDICDAVAGSITFTSDDGTVVITSTGGNNYDLKVGQITGMNIVNETVFGADIATATVGERQLAPNSVGASELQDNTVGKDEIQEAAVGTLEIIDGTIQPSDMQPGAFDQILTTDAGGNVVWLNKNELGATQADQTTITGAGTAADPIKVADTVIGDILANANNISQNSADIAANTAALGTKEDVANKSDDTNLGNSTTLYPTQNAVKTYVDLAAGAVSSLNSANIFVGNAGNVATGVAMSGDATINNTGVVTIANNAVTNDKLDKANIPLSGFGAAAAPVSLGTNRLTNVANPTATDDAATKAYVDAQVGGVGGTGDITSNDLTITNGINAAFNDVNLEITAGAVGTAELSDDSVSSVKILNANVTPIKIQPGAANQIMTTNGAGVVTWAPVGSVGGNQDLTSVLGNGTSAGSNRINDLLDPVAAQDAATMAYVDSRTDGSETEINAGTNITISGNGTNGSPYIINATGGAVADDQQLTLAGNSLTLEDGGAAISLVPYLDNTDEQNAAAVPVAATPTNYTAGASNVEAHLAGIDAAIGAVGGNQDLASVLGNGTSAGNNQINNLSDPTAPQDAATMAYVLSQAADGSETIIDAVNSTIGVTGTGTSGNPYVLTGAAGNPAAADITFSPTVNTTSNNVQAAIEELQTEIDGITTTGTNPNDELITSFTLSGTSLNIIENANTVPSLDLDPVFATDAELLASISDGSETIINPSATVSVSGSGTTLDPYVLTSTGADGSETKVN
ncbi:hypothetical protein, partial [Arenibacter sp. S6351L]|uniref:beta strand repeat-containing protein n=1 Tax=Arenibacter sp. S6351L TaxID=2926407 RepID=UPI001FF2D8B4